MRIVDFSSEHSDAVLLLNARFVHWLSPLDAAALADVLDKADYARCAVDESGALLGTLIAYRSDVDYPDHWNLEWLRGRMCNFVYIDRIIISETTHGRGVARALYADLERFARSQGADALTCEVNTRPDNPRSHAFHLRSGFLAIGDRAYPDGRSAVRYYAKTLQPRATP